MTDDAGQGSRMTEIAPLGSDEFDTWLPLWRGYQSFYKADIPDETTQLTFARLTGGEEPMGGFLARRDGRAVGMVHWIAHRSCWTPGDYCYLQDLFVAPDLRGGGVGRQLIEAVYAARRIPAVRARLLVDARDQHAGDETLRRRRDQVRLPAICEAAKLKPAGSSAAPAGAPRGFRRAGGAAPAAAPPGTPRPRRAWRAARDRAAS